MPRTTTTHREVLLLSGSAFKIVVYYTQSPICRLWPLQFDASISWKRLRRDGQYRNEWLRNGNLHCGVIYFVSQIRLWPWSRLPRAYMWIVHRPCVACRYRVRSPVLQKALRVLWIFVARTVDWRDGLSAGTVLSFWFWTHLQSVRPSLKWARPIHLETGIRWFREATRLPTGSISLAPYLAIHNITKLTASHSNSPNHKPQARKHDYEEGENVIIDEKKRYNKYKRF